MTLATTLHLQQLDVRRYQANLWVNFRKQSHKRYLALWPRRAGKDLIAWNLLFRAAWERVGVYFIVYPTYTQGRKILWDSSTNDGLRFLDCLPREWVESTNSTEMKVRLKNGSLIQVVGSDNYDSLVGTNPLGCIFSEYALQDPRAYQFLRPALTHSQGWALFITTPRGHNHCYDMFQIATNNPELWWCEKLTVEDTGHIPLVEIQRELATGEMSEDLVQQEYYCSFEMGIEGSYYSKYIDRMRLAGQISTVPYESGFKVHTSWDIGNDSTSIIFFQNIGTTIHIIDAYENSGKDLTHYVKILNQKPWAGMYGRHIGPHDLRVKEWAAGGGATRVEIARNLGIQFTIADDLSIEDGIEKVRATLSKVWIDEKNCAGLIKALENYRKEYDAKRRIYKDLPLHDWSSHYADSMRYLSISLPKTRDGLSPEELDKRYADAMGGNNAGLPRFFRDDLPNY